MNLVGFFNRSQTYPAPLISVVHSGDSFFAIYPSGDKVRLKNVITVDQITSRESFVFPCQSTLADEPSLSFGLSDKKILSGTKKSVCGELQRIVDFGSPQISEEDRSKIRQFLIEIKGICGKLTADEFKEFVSREGAFSVQLNPRVLRRSKNVAATLIVQFKSHSSTRTLYRKGIPVEKQLRDVFISKNVVDLFQQLLLC